jgi:hypothetical protein
MGIEKPNFLDQEQPIPEPKEEKRLLLNGESLKLKAYKIGNPIEVAGPGQMETGETNEVLKLYHNEPLLVSKNLESRLGSNVPYSFLYRDRQGNVYGNYTNPKGQDEFMNTDLELTESSLNPPDWVQELWEFTQLKSKRNFTFDNTMACLRGVTSKNGILKFTVGPGPYSDYFYSNGMDNLTIDINPQELEDLSKKLSSEELDELKEASKRLQQKYGNGKTIREIIFSKYKGIAPFGDHVSGNNIGVAGTVLTVDNQVIFVQRGSSTSVNAGLSACTASGGAEFDKEFLSKHGFQHFIGQEMNRETQEELGFKAGSLLLGAMQERIKLELGIEEDDYDIVPVGFIRELTRGASPESMFLIRYKGTEKDAIKSIVNNKHEGKKEIDQMVYTQPIEEVAKAVKLPGIDQIYQHKGLVNLILGLEYLKNTSES